MCVFFQNPSEPEIVAGSPILTPLQRETDEEIDADSLHGKKRPPPASPQVAAGDSDESGKNWLHRFTETFKSLGKKDLVMITLSEVRTSKTFCTT